MSKKVAVLAANPVNGFGLFEYLESFFENGISYRVFAVADTREIKTNSGVVLTVDDVVANLKGREDAYDALVFACGDAIPNFKDEVGKAWNQDMLSVMRAFADKGKLMIGHCAAALMYENLGLVDGRRVAIHPYAKPAVQKGKATDAAYEVDGNFFTAQTENTLYEMMPAVIAALK